MVSFVLVSGLSDFVRALEALFQKNYGKWRKNARNQKFCKPPSSQLSLTIALLVLLIASSLLLLPLLSYIQIL